MRKFSISTKKAKGDIPETALIKNPLKSLNGISGGIKKIMSRFDFDDILLFAILFLLIEEGVDDDFLILIIVFLILTG